MACIELKAKAPIKSPKKFKELLDKEAKFSRRADMNDYFFGSEDFRKVSELRFRKSEDNKEVTLKLIKERGLIQRNEESRFRVDNPADFIEFLEHLGFKPHSMIHKRSEFYKLKDVTVELAHIREIGDFVEFKIQVPETNIEEGKGKLLDVIKRLGIKKTQLDGRDYHLILQGFRK